MWSMLKVSPPWIVNYIKDNVLKTGNPLGISAKDLTSWSKGLNIPRKGEIVLYTGCEYQLLPYIVGFIGKLEKIWGIVLTGPKLKRITLSIADLLIRASARDRDYYNNLLALYANLLRKIGVDFSYLYEDELYAGGLLYEFGLEEEFSQHANRVAEVLRKNSVRKIITISPHTLELFRLVYPKYVDNFDIEALHFLELIKDKIDGLSLKLERSINATLHDPCHLARTLDMVNEPREILESIKGFKLIEPEPNTKKLTKCCGAPIETIFPHLSRKIAENRLKELKRTGASCIITLCPFCLASFRRAGSELEIKDFVELLTEVIR